MNLQEFFRQYPKAALAFSGGVDSAYLLYAGISHGCDMHAYYVKSAFQPAFELEDAKRLARELGAKLTVLEPDILAEPRVRENPADRCYYCKKKIFGAILAAAKKDGYELLLDGNNASDDASDRPGMKAAAELLVLSPLRQCGLTKAEIRARSKEAGLFTWNKPAYACLATRIPAGREITEELLRKTEAAEGALAQLGFTDFRIRLNGNAAKLQVLEAQLEKLLLNRKEILNALQPYYDAVTLDLEVRT